MKTLARARDKAEILRRVRLVRPDSARRWGRMSAHQMVCHLTDTFRVVVGQKPAAGTGSAFDRTVLKWVALYVPVPWPPGIRTTPEVDQLQGGTPPAEFAADVADLEGMVELITAVPRAFAWQVHPRLGPMSHPAWMRWAYLHMDHHLRQFGCGIG